ncbi:MAG: DUF2163 domain-containing protein [Alphaproteobacteria bacterium]|nr:DUF2163 domain-containing protein [Alphaproteobacteria bacterium]MBV8548715.1 DUF2163 domain-containing protein [Alphaproteobacteria bacterium]
MKNITPTLAAHLTSECTTLAWLIKLTRRDGTVIGFTTCDKPLTVAGVTYQADGAITASAMTSSDKLATDNLEINGILSDAGLDDADIEAGLYDHARVDVYVCNWADLTQGVVQMRRGWLGQIVRSGVQYVAELRGLHDNLQRVIGDYYTAECRHDLGDSGCGVVLATQTVTGSVTLVADNATFGDTTRTEGEGVFNYGKLIFTSGANQGLSMEVKGWTALTQTFVLWLPMPNPIQVGDTYSVYSGCDKRLSTCRDKFSNVVNFSGFPYLPGVGNILKYPT